jgi:predicted anti-sigma-YlaC factor YlaD
VLKVKTNSEIICDTELISRYIDDELDSDELARLKTHITGCKSCRARVDDYGIIGAGLNSFVQAQTGTLTGEPEYRVVEAIRRKNSAGIKGWKEVIFSKRILVPVGLAVSIIFMFMTFFSKPAPIGPTAIVSSLSGSGSSVVVLETAGTRQTIIWIGENG